MYDRIESDEVLRRAKGVLDIRVTDRRWNRRPERLPALAYSLPYCWINCVLRKNTEGSALRRIADGAVGDQF